MLHLGVTVGPRLGEMHSFRSHMRPWAWVPLLALMLQLGLASGHTHAIHPGQPALTTGTATAPPTDGGDSDDNDFCATCAILALLTSAQAASAPMAAPPAGLASAE